LWKRYICTSPPTIVICRGDGKQLPDNAAKFLKISRPGQMFMRICGHESVIRIKIAGFPLFAVYSFCRDDLCVQTRPQLCYSDKIAKKLMIFVGKLSLHWHALHCGIKKIRQVASGQCGRAQIQYLQREPYSLLPVRPVLSR